MTTVVLSRRQVTAWRNALFVTFALVGFALSSWLARVPAARDGLDVTNSALGIVLFGLSGGSLVGLLLSSHLIVRFGSARAVLLGLGIGVLGLPVAALGVELGSPVVCFIGLAVYGAGSGLSDVSMNVAGAANERAVGRNIMPLFHAMFSGGTVVGVGVGALAEVAGVPILAHLAGMAVMVLVALVIAVRFFQSDTHDVDEHDEAADAPAVGWRARLGGWREPRTLLIGLIALGMAFAEGSANDWLPLAMKDGHGLDNAGGALVLAVFLAAMTAGRILGVPVLDRFGRVVVLRVSALVAVVGLTTLIFVPSTAVAVVGAVFWGLGAALGFPVAMSAAADDPRRAAARVSVVSTIGYLAFLVGPPVLGFLGDHIGLLHALTVVLVLVFIAGIASGAARPLDAPAAPRRADEAPDTAG